MNLKNLTDDTLLIETERAAHREREALSIVLHHIREVDRRRLYSKLKCASLADYMIKHLKYTEDQAWPRISAMKLLKEIPEIASKINDGTLSLSNLNLARRSFLQEEKATAGSPTATQKRTTAEKIAVLEKLENVSKRDAEKILRQETGVVIKATESTRELNDGTFELKTQVSKTVIDLIGSLKGRLAHSNPKITTGELLELALVKFAEAKDPTVKAARATAARPVPERAIENETKKSIGSQTTPPIDHEMKLTNAPPKSIRVSSARYIPAAVRHHVWLRDGGACTNCGSLHAIQYEHVVPVALGGESTIENMKLLCRSCNQRTAIEVYGVEKISRYVKSPERKYVPFPSILRSNRRRRVRLDSVSYNSQETKSLSQVRAPQPEPQFVTRRRAPNTCRIRRHFTAPTSIPI